MTLSLNWRAVGGEEERIKMGFDVLGIILKSVLQNTIKNFWLVVRRF